MQTKWKIIIPILIVAALAAAFFLQGDEPEIMAGPVAVEAESTEVSAPVAPDVQQAEIVAAEPVIGPVETAASEPAETTVAEPVEPVSAEPAESGTTAEPAEAPAVDAETQPVVTEVTEGPAPVETPAAEIPAAEAPSTETPASETPAQPEQPAETPAAEEPVPMTVTISISCATINNNLNSLDPAKTGLVPADGWLLKETVAEFNEGESVFNVLQRICKQNKLHMEFMNTPVYNSAYIEGIGNLYEFDCGPLSGWMYSVNDWYPNYGSSRYELKAGDVIRWRYTCDLGNDIGGGYIDNLQKDD